MYSNILLNDVDRMVFAANCMHSTMRARTVHGRSDGRSEPGSGICFRPALTSTAPGTPTTTPGPPINALTLIAHLSTLTMPTLLSIVLSLFGLFLIHLLLGIRRVARNVGSVTQCNFDLEIFNRRVTFPAISPDYSFFLTHFQLWDL